MARRWIGAVWAIAGIGLFASGARDLVELAVHPQYGWNGAFFVPAWWYVQIGTEFFILACAFVGFGIMSGKRWALWGLKVLGPIALLYLAAYNVFGGERAWWVAVGAVVLTVVVGVSVYYAYHHGNKLAA
jgi:hypothetical protein